MNTEVPTPEEETVPENDVTDNDKLMAALSYPIPILAIVILLSETNKARPFQKFHAVQALAFWVVVSVIGIVLSIVTLGIGALCFPVLWLVSLWPAYKSYQGEYMEMPVITDFIRNQGWV
ncbi:MAG: DUF4870 domain-containing protein [Anaerolineales bacterium]|nr:MAG: DUF4870 domain-containing protein [Anaerolineales bacterium]